MKILIVDDHAAVRERLTCLLRAITKHSVITAAASVAEALQQLRMDCPDLVILDLFLPDGSGLDVLKVIKQEKWQTRVFIVTNHSEPQFRKRCLLEGEELFFDKSEEYEDMIDSILAVYANC